MSNNLTVSIALLIGATAALISAIYVYKINKKNLQK